MTQYPDERGRQYSGNEPTPGQTPYTGSTNQPPYTGPTGQPQPTGPTGQPQYTGPTGQSPYAAGTTEPQYREEPEQYEEESIGRPGPLGLGMLAFTIVMIGAFYASFIIPYTLALPSVIDRVLGLGMRSAIAPILLAGGIVEILVGMWAFRRHAVNMASVFTAYGGFLLAIGYTFLPTGILLPLALAGAAAGVLGFIYLCWAIFTAILMMGTVRVNSFLRATLALMVLTFLILAIGHFAGSITLLRVGGWIAIITALVAWAGTAMDLLGRVGVQENISQLKQRPARQPAAV